MATIEKQLKDSQAKNVKQAEVIEKNKTEISDLKAEVKEAKKLEDKVTRLEEAILGHKGAVTEFQKTITGLKAEVTEAKKAPKIISITDKEAAAYQEEFKKLIGNSQSDFIYDDSIETIEFKDMNDTFVGRHLTTIYRNDDKLEGQDFRDAVEKNELTMLHVFMDIKEGQMNYINIHPDIDKAVLKNHRTKNTMKIVCQGKNKAKQLTFVCSEL